MLLTYQYTWLYLTILQELAKQAGVEMIPTFHFFRGGSWVGDLTAADEYKLEQAIQTQLKKSTPVTIDQGKPIQLRCTKVNVKGRSCRI
jgi:hypothetical protein